MTGSFAIRWILTLFVFGWLTPLAEAQAPGAGEPVARTDENSRIAHTELLEKTHSGQIDLYFAGDSITRRWGATDYPEFLAHWQEVFFGWNAANFAWGGDTTSNILWRLENGELEGVNPRVIVLLAGTNDIGGRLEPGAGDAKVADVTSGIGAILEVIEEKAPDATVVLMGIFPRNDGPAIMEVIGGINANIARLADGDRVRYLNINDRLADSGGRLIGGLSSDGLHLSLRGYQLWAESLTPLLRELLGPPADEDHAPPPTGNPAAR